MKVCILLLYFVGEDVCLILCDPTLVEVVGLLDSLASLCSKDSPSDLVTLAFNSLRDSPSTSPYAAWLVDTKPPVLVDCHSSSDPLLTDSLILPHGS